MSNIQLIKEVNPDFKDIGYYFKKCLDKYIDQDTRLLDIGCGRQTFGVDYYKKAAEWVGVDPDKEALADNTGPMQQKLNFAIKDIPESIVQFDLVIAQWVLEHLSDPDIEIKKISQLCKPGGYFIFTTTNLNSPLVWLSNISPTKIKKNIRKSTLGIDEEDTYPTKYLINRPAKIDRCLKEQGFESVILKTVGVLTYFAFNRHVLRAKVLFDKFVEKISFGRVFRTHIIGVYQKKV